MNDRLRGIATPIGARIVEDPDELDDFYSDVRTAHLYALADLEEPYWAVSRWYRRRDAVVGLVGLPGGDLVVYAVSTRDPHGTNALLVELAPSLPAGRLITGPLGMAESFDDSVADVGPYVDLGVHRRYALRDRAPAMAVAAAAGATAEPLHAADADELLSLYSVEPGAAFFLPEMLGDGAFVGVRVAGTLVASAGTHVLSDAKRLAAIGSVYVHPEYRGRSLGRIVTAGVIARLAQRVDDIGLNVAATNAPAIAIYEQLGFEAVLDYEEIELR